MILRPFATLPPILLFCFLTTALLAGAASVAAQTPAAWDWRDVDGTDYVLPVKNMGPCSLCYITIPVAMVESRRLVAHRNLGVSIQPVEYSMQYLLSCGSGYFGDFGCAGGNPGDPLEWIRDVGIPFEACYEYLAIDESCPTGCPDTGTLFHLQQPVLEVYNEWTYLDEQTLEEMIYQDGPVAVWMDLYNDFYDYDEGIYEHTTGSYICAFVVLVVGWGTEGATDYWICQNSWGTNWGEDGYIRVARTATHANCDFGLRTWWCSIDTLSPVPDAAANASMLSANYPNPFNPATTIRFRPADDGHARLAVYDTAGRLVRILVDGPHLGGRQYAVDWNGRGRGGTVQPSGTYFYRLDSAERSETGRMVLLR